VGATVNSSVGVRITVTDKEIREALTRLAEKDGGLVRVALKNIGQALLKSTRARFDSETAPDGSHWKPLNPEYKQGKRGLKILQGAGVAGGLLGSINARVTGNRLEIGTNKVYAAIHQFGGVIVPKRYPALVFRIGGKLAFARKVTIPARPFLGVSAGDRKMALEVAGRIATLK